MKRRRNKAERLRTAVELLPSHSREAMLRGIDENEIIIGAYTDGDGGICPMLAAHRNGGRTDFASFARAWDDFTGAAKHPRRATRMRRASRREVRALRTYLEMSLLADDSHGDSLAEIADEIRAERRAAAARAEPRPQAPQRPQSPRPSRERIRVWDLRGRRTNGRPLDVYEATAAASSEQLAEQSAD